MNYEKFMKKALKQAKKSLDQGEFPIGCVLVYEDKVIAVGRRKGTKNGYANEIDHAEIMALREFSCMRERPPSNKITLFSTLEPCLMCFGAIIINGIGKIVYAYEDVMGGATNCNLKLINPLYKNSEIDVVSKILREESKKLIADFFTIYNNGYIKDSLLARHALGTI